MGTCSSTPSTKLGQMLIQTTPHFWTCVQDCVAKYPTPGENFINNYIVYRGIFTDWNCVLENQPRWYQPKWDSPSTLSSDIDIIINIFESQVLGALNKANRGYTKAPYVVSIFLIEFVYLCKMYEFRSRRNFTEEAWTNVYKVAWNESLPTTLDECCNMLKKFRCF